MSKTAEQQMTEAVDAMRKTSAGISDCLSDFWDDGDVWGSLLSDGFALCDFCHDMGWPTPDEFGYYPSAAGTDDEDARYLELSTACHVGAFTREEMSAYLTAWHNAYGLAHFLGYSY